MKTPKISVLTPMYNTRPDDLRAMIESILNQTYGDFEFLLLNDSPDNQELKQIVDSYKDVRIKYLENDKNMGNALSFKKGIAESSGKYFTVLDGDDFYTINYI